MSRQVNYDHSHQITVEKKVTFESLMKRVMGLRGGLGLPFSRTADKGTCNNFKDCVVFFKPVRNLLVTGGGIGSVKYNHRYILITLIDGLILSVNIFFTFPNSCFRELHRPTPFVSDFVTAADAPSPRRWVFKF